MLVNLGVFLNALSPIPVIAGPNVTLLRFGLPLNALAGICPAALYVTLSTGCKSQPRSATFNKTALFITIVLTLLFPLNGK